MKLYFKLLFVIALAILIQGCAASKNVELSSSRKTLPHGCEVQFYSQGETTPEIFQTLGTIRIGDAGFSVSCGENEGKKEMHNEACKVGANSVIIISEHFPSLISTCYRATAKLVYIENKP